MSEERSLCKVKVDAKHLPASAVKKKVSPFGVRYYQVSFQLAIKFLTTLEFKLVCDDEVIGSVVADYI